MTDRHHPVLIVGGGLTGLSTAVFLAWHGASATLVERHPGTSEHPKARAINPRTMEVFGAVGMAEAVRAGRSPISGNTDLVHVETLAGHERMRMPSATPEAIDRISPASWTLIDQNQLEPILRRRAEEVGVDLRFGTELVALSQDGDGVRATLRERSSGSEYDVTADHLVAADGSRSPVRALLGIGHHGPGVITELVSFFFDADLTEALRGRRIIAAYVNNDEVRGTIIPLDNDRRWVMNVSYFPDRGQRAEDFDDQRCTAIVRAAVGVSDLPVTIVGGSRPGWDISARVADRMRDGRVLVAGDAAHVMPPTGAFGASTGIQDAYNLAWKLALVHRGLAGPALLDSYDQERRPVAERTVEQAMLRFAIREGKRFEDVAGGMVSEETMTFGYRYPCGAFLPEQGTDDTLEDPFTPGGRPGARAPHVILGDFSTIDLFGRNFVVLANGGEPDWAAAATSAGAKFGVQVDTHAIEPEVPGFAERYGLQPGGAALIRPDGFVAWRTARRPADPGAALIEALRTVLAV
ncbi:FAD-dependent oxidoreductase [Micromonospora mangrovi]|uniref:FAD-dependent oxidoreductase n=2 Tax=Micromonospora TaxID=1873 RepID=A0AAU7M2V7_9ACTN